MPMPHLEDDVPVAQALKLVGRDLPGAVLVQRAHLHRHRRRRTTEHGEEKKKRKINDNEGRNAIRESLRTSGLPLQRLKSLPGKMPRPHLFHGPEQRPAGDGVSAAKDARELAVGHDEVPARQPIHLDPAARSEVPKPPP